MLRSVLIRRGYLGFPIFPKWALEGPWTDLDDYLRSMSAHRSRRIRAEIRAVAAAGVTLRTSELTPDLARHAVKLAGETVARYGGSVDLDAYAQWTVQVGALRQARSRVHLAERDGEVVGCVVTSEHAGRIYPLFPGFDYKKISGIPIYLVLAYPYMVEHAIATGAHAIEYGPEADEAKRMRGCVRYDQSLWIKGLTRRSREAVQGIPR